VRTVWKRPKMRSRTSEGALCHVEPSIRHIRSLEGVKRTFFFAPPPPPLFLAFLARGLTSAGAV